MDEDGGGHATWERNRRRRVEGGGQCRFRGPFSKIMGGVRNHDPLEVWGDEYFND